MEYKTANPLLIPLVIKGVYKNLDFSDKKNFRLVCKAWIDEILSLWRKQTKLEIKIIDYYKDGLMARPQTADFILEYFNLYKIAEIPLLNLKLVNMGFSFLPAHVLEDASEEKKVARTFQIVQNLLANNFGHSLERLELVNCKFLEQTQPEAGFYYILLKYFPKLKAFSLRNPNLCVSFGHELILYESSFPRTQSDLTTLNLDGHFFAHGIVNEILHLIPNLKNVSLRGPACITLRVLSLPIFSSGSYILLDRLGIDHVYDVRILFRIPVWMKKYMEAALPPLKCLKASIPFGPFPSEVKMVEFPDEPFIYKPIWNCVGNTLTSLNLRIYMGLWSWCTLFTGYSLPKLTHLCLNFRELNTDLENDVNMYDEAVGLLHFDFGMLRGTPLLKKLHMEFEAMRSKRTREVGANLKEHELEWRGKAGIELRGPIVLQHMKDFRFELYHKPTEGCWRAFAEMMPNLRRLQGIVDEDTEPLVRQLWPDLNLIWSSLSRRIDDIISQSGIMEMREGTLEFGNEWQEADWENWNGKLNSVQL